MRLTDDARRALVREEFSRRDFLRRSGALIVTFSAFDVGDVLSAQGPFDTRIQQIDPRQLDAWIAVAADGGVTAYTGKCELGQGIYTAQVQLVAEELSVPMNRVRLIQCDTSMSPVRRATASAALTGTLAQSARATCG